MDRDLPFLGYYSPQLDGSLFSLLSLSSPGTDEREGLDEDALESIRTTALIDLEWQTARELSHDRAIETLRRTFREQHPVGLYLRCFALGYRHLATVPLGSERYEVWTHGDPLDGRVQNAISKANTPFVTIANHAGDSGDLDRLFFGDDWRTALTCLVAHCSKFVLLLDRVTPNISHEVEALRAQARQPNTLVVSAPARPTVAFNATTDPSFVLPDFTNGLQLERNRKFDSVLALAIDGVPFSARSRDLACLDSLPAPPTPAREVLSTVSGMARNYYDDAVRLLKARDGVGARDALTKAIVFCHWARDVKGRSICYFMLARGAQRSPRHQAEARTLFAMALSASLRFEGTADEDRDRHRAIVDGFSELLETSGEIEEARHVREGTWSPT